MTQAPHPRKTDETASQAAVDGGKTDPGSERGQPPRDRDSGAEPAGGSSSSEGTNARRSKVDPHVERGENDSGERFYTPPRI